MVVTMIVDDRECDDDDYDDCHHGDDAADANTAHITAGFKN